MNTKSNQSSQSDLSCEASLFAKGTEYRSAKKEGIRVKSSIKAGALTANHNEAEAARLTVVTGLNAGGMYLNHNEG